LITRIARVVQSDSLRATGWLGVGGAAFAAANLLLAGWLPADAFGRLVLVQALAVIATGIAPLGMDQLAVRREFPVRWESLRTAAATAAVVAILFGSIAAGWYRLPTPAVVAVVGIGVAGGVAVVCASVERSLVRLNRAMLITQIPNAVFAAGALLMRAAEVGTWQVAAGVLAGGYAVAAAAGLLVFRRTLAERVLGSRPWDEGERRDAWRKGFAFVGISGSVYLLFQMERLLLPHLLSLSELATFSVAATLAGSPYKILQGGIGYALVPKLRAAEGRRERSRMIRDELVLAAALALGGGAILIIAATPLVRLLYAAKYPVTHALVAAIVVSGVLSLLYAALSSAVYALADRPQLAWFNRLGWVATAGAAAGAVALSGFGIVGVVLGTSLGWLLRLMGALLLLRPVLGVPEGSRAPGRVAPAASAAER
jgi:O-antigen/teichoic acid export membrane protein